MKKKMNYSYKEHEFWLFFLYEVTETFVQFFRKYHDVFAKLP